ncbi:MAG TPA: hypothetical protein VD978_14880 [Azospirillum sp.]|nr:hypothetical protein [Azospirillum sp.]
MGDSYVDGKVREALQAAKGSPSMAQKLLITWAAQDPDLLLGMAQPFLKAIAGAAVARAGRRAASPARPAAGGGALSKEALERVLSRLGEADDGSAPTQAVRPVAKAASPVRQAPEGVTHEKSMMAIAKAFAAKRVR